LNAADTAGLGRDQCAERRAQPLYDKSREEHYIIQHHYSALHKSISRPADPDAALLILLAQECLRRREHAALYRAPSSYVLCGGGRYRLAPIRRRCGAGLCRQGYVRFF